MGARNAQEKDAADLSGVQRLPLKIALAIRGFLYFHTNLEIKKYGTLHKFACHPCAGAMLIFSVSFQF